MDKKLDPDALRCDDQSTSLQESVTIDVEHAPESHKATDEEKQTEKMENRYKSVIFDTKDAPKLHGRTDEPKEKKESLIIHIEDAMKYHNYKGIKVEKHKKTKKIQKDKLDKTEYKNVFDRSFHVYMGLFSSEDSDYDPDTRNRFVAWVFLTVFICILINTICVCIVRYIIPGLGDFIYEYMPIFQGISAGCLLIVLAMNCSMMCFAYCRQPPLTWVCLVIACICYSIALSIVTIMYSTILVILALATTASLCLLCFGLAMTSFDFTKCSIIVIVLFVVSLLLSGGLLLLRYAFNIYLKPLHITVLVFAVFMTCFTLIIQLQMILGGKAIESDEEDIAYPAFMLYVALVVLFMQLLRLCGLLDLLGEADDY